MVANFIRSGVESSARLDEFLSFCEKLNQLICRHVFGRTRVESCPFSKMVNNSGAQCVLRVGLVTV